MATVLELTRTGELQHFANEQVTLWVPLMFTLEGMFFCWRTPKQCFGGGSQNRENTTRNYPLKRLLLKLFLSVNCRREQRFVAPEVPLKLFRLHNCQQASRSTNHTLGSLQLQKCRRQPVQYRRQLLWPLIVPCLQHKSQFQHLKPLRQLKQQF